MAKDPQRWTDPLITVRTKVKVAAENMPPTTHEMTAKSPNLLSSVKNQQVQKSDFTIGKLLCGIKKKASIDEITARSQQQHERYITQLQRDTGFSRPVLDIISRYQGDLDTFDPVQQAAWDARQRLGADILGTARRARGTVGKGLLRMRQEIKNSVAKTAAVKREFAPGIPTKRSIDPIPTIKNKAWMLAVQKHEALRAGTHFDLRLVDPNTRKAHSFAIPKTRFPDSNDKPILAVEQPTHTATYALNFTGTIPKGTYGAGKVTMPIKEKVDIVKSNADQINFQRANGSEFVLFRMEGQNWGLKKKKKID